MSGDWGGMYGSGYDEGFAEGQSDADEKVARLTADRDAILALLREVVAQGLVIEDCASGVEIPTPLWDAIQERVKK
jgi:hypothetical protein